MCKMTSVFKSENKMTASRRLRNSGLKTRFIAFYLQTLVKQKLESQVRNYQMRKRLLSHSQLTRLYGR